LERDTILDEVLESKQTDANFTTVIPIELDNVRAILDKTFIK
jgi:hypothetical protein